MHSLIRIAKFDGSIDWLARLPFEPPKQ
jgi:hypothetical protein